MDHSKAKDSPARPLVKARNERKAAEVDMQALQNRIALLKKEVGGLENTCEGLLHREALKEAEYEEASKEILELEAEKQQLTDLIATLKPSKPEKGK